MWCSFSSNVVIPKHATLCYNKTLPPSVSASSSQTLVVVANLQSNTTPISKQGKQEGEQISGSDILWALQRASDRKNVKMKNKTNKVGEQGKKGKGSSSVEETAADYTNVRPLCINANWAPKLDDLEIRLRQLSDTI